MTKSQYTDLLEFLKDQFTKIDLRFDGIDQRFLGVDQRFIGVDKRFDSIENRLNNLEKGQDFILKEVKELREENTVGAYRSHRMEKWILLAAKKLDLPYNP